MNDHLFFLPSDRTVWPWLAVLLPNWNGHSDTNDCLDSLSQLDYPKSKIEVLIIDNGSMDGSQTILKNKLLNMTTQGWSRLELIELPSNIGIPGAYNAGYAHVNPNVAIILRTESDVTFHPDSVKHLISTLLSSDQVGIAGATIRNYRTREPEHGAHYFNYWNGRLRHVFSPHPIPCTGVLGCGIAISRKAIDQLPYFFDESLLISSDETDLSFRLARVGYSTWYNPHAVIYHKSGKSTGKVPKLSYYYSIRNGFLLFRRYAPFPQRWVYYSFVMLWLLKALLKGNVLAFRAIWGAVQLPQNPQEWSEEQRKWKSL